MSHMRWSLVCALVVCGVLILAITAAIAGEGAVPVFSDTGPDAADYGAAEGYPVGGLSERTLYLVGTYSHFDQVATVRTVAHAATPWPFRRAAAEPQIADSFRGGRYTIDDYLHRNPVTGLLIAKDDTILYEHYQYARSDGDRFLSQSMAKTITAMLVGIAVSEGAIKSIDDSVATYLPELADAEYGKTPIRALLHMSSGVAFSETYDGWDDIATLGRDLFRSSGISAAASVKQFNLRTAPPGTVWHYASVETEILGLVLRAATGKPVADYLRDNIWQRIGTEADASWAIDTHEQEVTYCCFNAVLRDYARFGRLLAHDGTWEGRQIIPRQWLIDATTVRPEEPYLAPGRATRFYGYGFQIWLLPGAERRFVMLGIRGQMIFVDPATKLVMAHTAVHRKPVDFDASAEAVALWLAVVQQLGGEGGRP
jgi:CubicO group peptidase (beta-lactamase class C family)